MSKFADIRQGDHILTLEQDRRSQFPIFDMAQVQKISAPSYQRMGPDDKLTQVITLTITDSTGTFNVTVPMDAEDTIWDKIYLTPNPQLIYQEIMVQKSRAQSILSNIDRYKAIDTECDKILARLNPNGNHSQPSPSLSASPELLAQVIERVETQGKMIEKMYKSLFPDSKEN